MEIRKFLIFLPGFSISEFLCLLLSGVRLRQKEVGNKMEEDLNTGCTLFLYVLAADALLLTGNLVNVTAHSHNYFSCAQRPRLTLKVKLTFDLCLE